MNDWSWYCSNNEEFYHGEFSTREEAIAVGWEHFGGEGALFITEARHEEPTTDIFDFDHILERYDEKNEEHWGEDGEPLVDIKFKGKRGLEQELAATLRRYLAKNDALRSWAFAETRNREVINMDASNFFPSQDYQMVLIGAFRYALGRTSYVVSHTVDVLISEWKELDQELIVKEVTEAIAGGRAGAPMDVQQWNRLLDHARDGSPKDSQMITCRGLCS